MLPIKLENLNKFAPYKKAEEDFISFIKSDDLDARILASPEETHSFNEKLDLALDHAFLKGKGDDSAHILVQRCLYHVNRLKLFWYDDLKNYSNENSWFLFNTRSKIEKKWSAWEENQISNKRLDKANIVQALYERAEEDLNPELCDETMIHIFSIDSQRLSQSEFELVFQKFDLEKKFFQDKDKSKEQVFGLRLCKKSGKVDSPTKVFTEIKLTHFLKAFTQI